jgi:hypothetical protein
MSANTKQLNMLFDQEFTASSNKDVYKIIYHEANVTIAINSNNFNLIIRHDDKQSCLSIDGWIALAELRNEILKKLSMN